MTNGLRTIFALVVLLSTSLGVPVRDSQAAAPAIRLSAASGATGAPLRITLSGFAPNRAVRVRWDEAILASAVTNGRGRLNLAITIPSGVGGTHTVRANAGSVSASARFTIVPSVGVEPARIAAAGGITVRLTGFVAGERIVLSLKSPSGTKRLTTVIALADGTKTKAVTIPAETVAGKASLLAVGASGATGKAGLRIDPAAPEPSVTPTPEPSATAPAGAAIQIWVDPNRGNDDASGGTRASAVRTLAEAWNRVPSGRQSSPVRILLVAGDYPAESLPNYMESRHGTAAAPISIEAADEPGSAVLHGGLNLFDVRYLSLIGLTLRTAGDVVHCEQCDHFVIDRSTLDGQGAAQETLKINQSTNILVTNSDIAGAWDNAIDFVAVQHGRITGNAIHDAQDWCMYVKGGSADFWIEGNEIYSCGTGGFTAGQGTGFQFMTPPYLTYEAEDVTFIRNEIHDTDGAGMGVSGGKDVLLAENHLVRVGARSHLLEIGFGARSCDGQPGDPGRDRCADYLAQGGWGTTAVDDGTNYVRISNNNVTVRDNVFANPAGYQSRWQHFSISGPYSGASQSGSNAPDPAYADDGLVITGNSVTNGDASMPLGLGDDSGCQPTNPTCNETQLLADNDINGR